MESNPLPLVLVCDDEVEIADLVAENIAMEGYRTQPAYDGEDALEKIKAEKPNLVITDVRMPRGDGVWLLNKIRDLDPDLPVFICSGFPDITEKQFIGMGATRILQKPLDYAALFVTLSKLLKS